MSVTRAAGGIVFLRYLHDFCPVCDLSAIVGSVGLDFAASLASVASVGAAGAGGDKDFASSPEPPELILTIVPTMATPLESMTTQLPPTLREILEPASRIRLVAALM